MKCLLFFALLAGYRLPAGKHTGILPNFRTKVNKKGQKENIFRWSVLLPEAAMRNL